MHKVHDVTSLVPASLVLVVLKIIIIRPEEQPLWPGAFESSIFTLDLQINACYM